MSRRVFPGGLSSLVATHFSSRKMVLAIHIGTKFSLFLYKVKKKTSSNSGVFWIPLSLLRQQRWARPPNTNIPWADHSQRVIIFSFRGVMTPFGSSWLCFASRDGGSARERPTSASVFRAWLKVGRMGDRAAWDWRRRMAWVVVYNWHSASISYCPGPRVRLLS